MSPPSIPTGDCTHSCAEQNSANYTVNGHEPCVINTKDATELGIKHGEIVRVYNDRGQILAGAKATDAIRPGAARVSEGGWYDPAEPSKTGTLSEYGDVNVLSMDVGPSKLGQDNCGDSICGEVENYKDPAVTVDVFTAPNSAD
jgi:trimethylamine-N-oxide reductase (cytochrome c)